MRRITTCPHCSACLPVSDPITDKTLICPHCHVPVGNPRSEFRIRAAAINTNVKRNLSVGSIILFGLIGLCVLGIATLAIVRVTKGNGGEDSIARAFLLMLLFAALDVLVSIAIVGALVRWGIYRASVPSIANVLGIILLSVSSVVAIIIFFSFTCFYLVN